MGLYYYFLYSYSNSQPHFVFQSHPTSHYTPRLVGNQPLPSHLCIRLHRLSTFTPIHGQHHHHDHPRTINLAPISQVKMKPCSLPHLPNGKLLLQPSTCLSRRHASYRQPIKPLPQSAPQPYWRRRPASTTTTAKQWATHVQQTGIEDQDPSQRGKTLLFAGMVRRATCSHTRSQAADSDRTRTLTPRPRPHQAR